MYEPKRAQLRFAVTMTGGVIVAVWIGASRVS
jgi:hypothetical protein